MRFISNERGFVRKTAAFIATFGMLAALTGCSAGPASGCDSNIQPGDASSIVTATGKFASEPSVDFPTPLVTKKTQRSELLPGDGAPLQDGESALIDLTVLNGATGAEITKTGYDGIGGSLATIGPSDFNAISLGLSCATVGSRVAIVASAKDSHDGQASPQQGIGADDAFVFVIDILQSFPAKASGVGQLPERDLPAVVLAPDGTPGITVPQQDPPKDLTVAVLQAANGAKLKADDLAVLKYTGLTWDDHTVFDSTWKDGQAVVTRLTASDSVAKGFVDGLVGQKVGSQVLLVIPPELATGSGAPANATAVYVVDILGVIPRAD